MNQNIGKQEVPNKAQGNMPGKGEGTGDKYSNGEDNITDFI